jgi:hypothetical protein
LGEESVDEVGLDVVAVAGSGVAEFVADGVA